MGRKYLEEIGWQPMDLDPKDQRHLMWQEQREAYGFDETETWNLDTTIYELIYERLMMFNEINGVDTEFHHFTYKGRSITFQECIDGILGNLKSVITDDISISDRYEKSTEAMELFALCCNHLWW